MAAFQRQKKLPQLDRVMRRLSGKAPEKQSPKQLLTQIERFNKSFGGDDLRKR